MSVDVRVIIGHNLSIKDAINFPHFLKNNTELKEVYIKEIQSKIDHNYSLEKSLSSLNDDFNWENVTENDLLKSWINNESLKLVSENGFITYSLNTYFGILNFHKQTIDILYLPEHKYANLHYESHRKFILNFSQQLAKCLGTKIIIYCSDSGPTEVIEHWATEGKSIELIKKLAISKFGMPPNILSKAIENRFFIDTTISPLI